MPGLRTPLLKILGNATFSGTVAVTLFPDQELVAPIIRISGTASFTGSLIVSVGSVFPYSVRDDGF